MYKQGQGLTSRIGVACLGMLLGFYSGYEWYYWRMPEVAPTTLLEYVATLAFIGSIALFAGLTLLGSYLAFVNPKSCDYVIDMDAELKKVVWPTVLPIFDPQAEAWGSTYVVIVYTVILSVYIYLVDIGLDFVITKQLLSWLS